ncbi:MAG TPA: hypothetical protein VHC49_00610 [Mycobacteriales bacterium]|nr:hypothetical protein [Mycobacteriales bacterium]
MKSTRRIVIGTVMSMLWLTYLAGGVVAFFLSGRSAAVGMGYLLAALMLGWCVVLAWRRR